MKKKVAVLGEGAFGTAFAQLLAENNNEVHLWCYHAHIAKEIKARGYNTIYLPDIQLHSAIYPTTNLQEALEDADYIFEAIPVIYLRTVLQQCKPFVKTNQSWIVLSKGIEADSLLFPGDLVEDILGSKVRYTVVAGPSFAYEIVRHQYTRVNVASAHTLLAQEIVQLCTNNYFKVDVLNDVRGIQITGAFKNVIALASGIAQGAGWGNNTQALIFAQGMQEMEQLVQLLGGNKETVKSWAGVGDLFLTSTSTQSKNYRCGMVIGAAAFCDLDRLTGPLPEGVNSIQAFGKIIEQHHSPALFPLTQALYTIIYNGVHVDSLIKSVMNNELI